jgi:N-acetylglucosaminyldiphosphoundecaprenol N-acetyl-beta-D-mannosaminyltransferase
VSTKVHLFGIAIDVVDRCEAACRIAGWLNDRPTAGRIVIPTNTDCVVRYQRDSSLRATYQAASLVVADGMPLVWASRLVGAPLPERVTGCDLIRDLFTQIASSGRRSRPLTVYLLGAPPGVARRAGEQIMRRWRNVLVVGDYSPPPGFEANPTELTTIVERINMASPDLVIVGLGMPKQEKWAAAHVGLIRAKAIVCAGASIDFMAGAKRRAPRWMQEIGLEWAFRLMSEPRRLWRRYAVDLISFPPLVLKEWIKQHRPLPGQHT